MNSRTCQSFQIKEIVDGSGDFETDKAFEEHVESCPECQHQLTQVTGGDGWWTKAAAHLSTVKQMKIPDPIRVRLADSRSFIIPTLVTDQIHAEALTHRSADWRSLLDPPTHPEMVGKIDHFEIEDKIGEGGMGIVLKGVDRELDRAVAIKVLAPHLANNGTSRQRFAREAQAAAAVVHPNVVPIYAVNSSPARPYIVMQLVSGHSLQSLVKSQGPLATREIVRVMVQVASGLAAAHQQGLIHRDIKPGNVLIEKDVSRVMITDFGLARAVDDAGMTQTGWIAGTPHYMSPEQARGDSIDCRSDLFSLGALMYFISTGREPFRAEKPFAVVQKIITERPVGPQELNPELPTIVSDVISKLLEKNPNDRFQSATEVQMLLERYLAHLQQPWKVPKPKRPLAPTQIKRRWLVASSVTGLVMLCLLGFWGVHSMVNSIGNNRPTSESSAASNSEAFSKKLSGSFFPGDSFGYELQEINETMELLEQSLQKTDPLDSGFQNQTSLEPALWQSIQDAKNQASILQSHEDQQRKITEALIRKNAIREENENNKNPNPPENP